MTKPASLTAPPGVVPVTVGYCLQTEAVEEVPAPLPAPPPPAGTLLHLYFCSLYTRAASPIHY